MKVLLILFITYFYSFASEEISDKFLFTPMLSNNSLYINSQPGYKICKRPLQNVPNIDYTMAEKNTLNLQHYHLFRIDFSITENYDIDGNLSPKCFIPTYTPSFAETLYTFNDVQTANLKIQYSCDINKFSNIGYFGESTIKCNENIKNYPKCSEEIFDSELIEKALKASLAGLSKEYEYSMVKYNCQKFINTILDKYSDLLVYSNMSKIDSSIEYVLYKKDISKLNYIKNELYILSEVVKNKK